MEYLTLVYYANGGDSTPADDNQPYTGNPVTFTLADAITKDSPTGKYRFVGWEINGTVYEAKEQVSLDKNYLATAIFAINDTTVSTKDYGYSPNGTKNALGTTRYHHQPSYPHAMGVGARRTTKPTVPPTPTPPTPSTISFTFNRDSGTAKAQQQASYSTDGTNFTTVTWGNAYQFTTGTSLTIKVDAGTDGTIATILLPDEETVWPHWTAPATPEQIYETTFTVTNSDEGGFYVRFTV